MIRSYYIMGEGTTIYPDDGLGLPVGQYAVVRTDVVSIVEEGESHVYETVWLKREP